MKPNTHCILSGLWNIEKVQLGTWTDPGSSWSLDKSLRKIKIKIVYGLMVQMNKLCIELNIFSLAFYMNFDMIL